MQVNTSPIYPLSSICIAQIGFSNASGEAVGPSKVVNLTPGQGDSLDLNGAELGMAAEGRAEVRPVITVLSSPIGVASACLAKAELLDS